MEVKLNITATFQLDRIAATLEGLEETIIYRLLDRGQFAHNLPVYQAGASHFPGWENHSLLEARLHMQEDMDARFGRFMVPEERPFCSDLPQPGRTPPKAENEFPISNFEIVNQSKPIMAAYLGLLSKMCPLIDDGHYGSTVELDVYVLQALARRIHFGGLYVAESKFLADPITYGRMIAAGDHDGIMKALTRVEVEERILVRVREKIDWIQKSINTAIRRVVDPELIMHFYRESIIPLTKDGEVAYLLSRPH